MAKKHNHTNGRPKNAIDHIPLTFGKHKGKTPHNILDSNPSYLIWMYENISPPPCTKELYATAQLAVIKRKSAEEEIEDNESMNEISAEYHATNYGDRD